MTLGNRCARAVILSGALLFTAVAASEGQSIADFVAGTPRSLNGEVLSLLLGSDTTDAVSVAKALGRRSDPYVGDILEGLLEHMSGPQSYRTGLLLRITLEYVFLLPKPAPAKIQANSSSLRSLLRRLQTIGDAATKGALLQIAVYLPTGDSRQALLDEGAFLFGYLRSTAGKFAPDRLSEAQAFLGACTAHDNEVLRNEVVRLVEVARDKDFVGSARRYLAGR